MSLNAIESAFRIVWHASLRASALMVAILIVQALAGKRLPARFHYSLGLLILLRLIVPVTLSSGWNPFNFRHPTPSAPVMASVSPARLAPEVKPEKISFDSHALPSRPPGHLRLDEWFALAWMTVGTGFLITMLWRHWKFLRWSQSLTVATDPLLIELVNRCKNEARVKSKIKIAMTPRGTSAAVFGVMRPCLLVPEGLLETLGHHESRLVLLHEMLHIRRRDLLVNWLRTFALALHWFNPLAWIAMRRLRLDQELACDASVLGLIAPPERGDYGRALLKCLEDFPAARSAAGLVPFITLRHNIKKRIIMITEFKKTGGWTWACFVFLIFGLGGLGFTRAADEPDPKTPMPTDSSSFQQKLTRIQTDGSSNDSAPVKFLSGTASPSANSSQPNHDYVAEFAKESAMLEQLKKMQSDNHELFIQALSTTVSDTILNSLLEQKLAQETSYEKIRIDHAADNNQKRDEQEDILIYNLEQKIEQRAKGIMAGMQMKVAALKEVTDKMITNPDKETLRRQLEDWDRQRVGAETDYLMYSNIVFNLNMLPASQLGGALSTAYAHQLDSELASLSERVLTARAEFITASNSYGREMPIFQSAKKRLEDAEAAYQRKTDAVMLGLRNRVEQDKGFLQIIQRKEDEITKQIQLADHF
jgi:bla regulator protein BlaR1